MVYLHICQQYNIYLCVLANNINSIILKKSLKITQIKKVRFIKVNKLKLTQVELFYFFTLCVLLLMHPKQFCMVHLSNTSNPFRLSTDG